MQRILILTCCLAGMACAARAEVPDSVKLPESSVAFYRRAFADAQNFVPKRIPEAMLAPIDRSNDRYYEVYSKSGRLLGYLRDFSGPVSPADACPCNPLSLTLAFNPDRGLRSLISPAPLQKYGHAPLSDEEHARLEQLLKAPPAALLSVRRVEDMVDATTGATKLPLAPVVVPQAALSTRRLAGVVRDTQEILRGAPAGRDRERLHGILVGKSAPMDQAKGLAVLLPSLESPDLKRQAYYFLSTTYLNALDSNARGDHGVESVLLQPGLAPESEAEDVAHVCYRLADKGLRGEFVRTCATSLESSQGVPPGAVALLRGTERLAAGEAKAALPSLREASRRFSASLYPELHLRLSQAYVLAGQPAAGCRHAERLFAEHSLMPGLSEALQACVTPTRSMPAVVAGLQEAARASLLEHALPPGPPVAPLELENDAQKIETVPLHAPGKVTIAVFFATWCPHCRAELPRVKAFVKAASEHPQWKDKLRVVGVRTAVEKENEPYEAFKAAVGPNFPIYTDANLSLAFSAFAKATGVPAGLPTTAVIDERGAPRFFLEPGDFRDTQSELGWAVESLLAGS